jgi:hypothetical protein
MKMREFHILYIEWGAKLKIVKQLLVSAQRYDRALRNEDNLWLIASVAVLASVWVLLIL